MKTIIKQFVRIAAWLSQGINVLLLGGHQDQTLSARLFINRNKKYWRIGHKVVNIIFFWEDDHCYKSHMKDIEWARELLIYHKKND